jgi:hypothetical protein
MIVLAPETGYEIGGSVDDAAPMAFTYSGTASSQPSNCLDSVFLSSEYQDPA